MLERTIVFVDTSYLLASFYNSWEIGARAQLEIDLPEVVATLGAMIENQLGQKVQRQNWYDGIPDTGPHRYQRALRTCDGVQLRTGQLIEWGERRTQKAVDTRLVADMIVTALRGHVTDIVLVSGDADMIPGVEEAVNAGIRVHLYGFGWDSMSSALRHACDSTTILDPREDFSECMELEVLEGPLPPVVREPHGEEGEVPALPERDECDEPSEVEAAFASAPRSARPTVQAAEPDQAAQAAGAAQPTSTSAAEETPAQPAATLSASLADATPAAPAQDSAPLATPTQPAARPTPTPGDVAAAVEQAHAEDNAKANTKANAEATAANDTENSAGNAAEAPAPKPEAPKPSMMAPRRKLRSRYVPLPEEVWTSAGFQTPFDVGQQYASWWFDHAATAEQRDSAHLLSGGGLPPEIDRPLLQFACETLHEYTLSETQRVNLRDGFHSGIRGVLIVRRG